MSGATSGTTPQMARMQPDRRQPDYYTGGPGPRSNLSQSIQRHYAGNDARMTGSPGSQENLTVEVLPVGRRKGRRRRVRSEQQAPTSATPGAYSEGTAWVPSGARY